MKLKLTLLAVLLSFVSIAQNGINYKAIIKDNLGNVVANQTIDIQFTILEDVTNVYQETHAPTTDANGLIIVNIGEGSTSDVFTDINWGTDDHFLNVQIDTGSGFVDMGTTQFMAVPYALSAANAATKIDDLSDGKSDTTGSSLFLGVGAGASDDGTSNRNVALGYQALSSNANGEGNVAIGYRAGFNETGSNKLYIANTDTSSPLIYGEFDTNKLTINGDFNINGSLRLNHTGPHVGSGSFTLTSPNSGYVGMYVNSRGTSSQTPFYGYSVGDFPEAWHSYNANTNTWELFVTDNNKILVDAEKTSISNNLSVDGKVLFNSNEQINTFTDFTLKSKRINEFGGMYIDIEGGGSAKPFYGYSVDGIEKAFSYYNEATASWNLNVGDVFGDLLVGKYQNLFVNGTLSLTTMNGSSEPEGTIFYYNGHFYGVTATGSIRLDNTSGSRIANDTNKSLKTLEEENKSLKKQLQEIKKYLQELEKKVLSQNKL